MAYLNPTRVNYLCEEEWKRHPAYPGPIPEPPHTWQTPERWRWDGGSHDTVPSWIWIEDDAWPASALREETWLDKLLRLIGL